MWLPYLTSIATGSLGMLLLMFLTVDSSLYSLWMVVLPVGYFSLYWRDLLQNGYRPADMLRLAAFNLMLLPINLAGVLKSIQQRITRVGTPSARTLKVDGRTSAPAWSVVALWLLLAWALIAGVNHLLAERWVYAACSMAIAAGFAYSSTVLVCITPGWEDATRGIQKQVGELSEPSEAPAPLTENMRRQ